MIIKVINIIGGLLVATSIGLIINKKKQEEGVETWEGNHGIIIKTWHIILCMVLGISLIFMSRAIQNGLIASKSSFSGPSSDREATTINDEHSQEFADTDTTANVVKPSDDTSSSEPAASSELNVTDIHTMGDEDKIENTSDSEQYDINVGGVSVTIELDPAWNLYLGDSFISAYPDMNTNVSYMDSYISVGDKTNIQNEVTNIKEAWKADVTTQEFTCNGDNAYSLEWYSEGEKFIRIFEPVQGARTYLKVEIEDYTGTQDSQMLIKNYAINF